MYTLGNIDRKFVYDENMNKLMVCEDCHRYSMGIENVIDSYSYEVYGKKVIVYQCIRCDYEGSMDI